MTFPLLEAALGKKRSSKLKLLIPNMSCGHCVSAIEQAVLTEDPIAIVKTELASKTAEIKSGLANETWINVLENAGYPASPIESNETT